MALATAILPLNLILQVVLLPVYLFIFFGSREEVSGGDILLSITIVLVFPMALAQLTKLGASKVKQIQHIMKVLLNQSDWQETRLCRLLLL